MEYHYIGLTGSINGIIKQLEEENIPWEYAEKSNEMLINAITCDITPEKMTEYLDNVLIRYSKILPIPKKVISNNIVDDTIIAHLCDLAYVRQNENDVNIIDSEKLHPEKFTNEFYENYFSKIEEERIKNVTDEDLIEELNDALTNLKELINAKNDEDKDFHHNMIETCIKSTITALNNRIQNNN